MATREEEVKNLQTMQRALQRQDELVKRIEDEELYIKEQYQRSVEDYPAYKERTFYFKKFSAKDNTEKKEKQKKVVNNTYKYMRYCQWVAMLFAAIACAISYFVIYEFDSDIISLFYIGGVANALFAGVGYGIGVLIGKIKVIHSWFMGAVVPRGDDAQASPRGGADFREQGEAKTDCLTY